MSAELETILARLCDRYSIPVHVVRVNGRKRFNGTLHAASREADAIQAMRPDARVTVRISFE